MFRVALDLLGGDHVPSGPAEGARAALEAGPSDLSLLLVGPGSYRHRMLRRLPADRVKWIDAEERIDPADPPARAVRNQPNSTIARGLDAVRSGEADAFVSAGSTGAIMAASVIKLGVLPGIKRPPVGAMFPTMTGRTLVLDVGAHVPHKRERHRRERFLQLAHLGKLYLKSQWTEPGSPRRRPRVGLLNIGEESRAGGPLHKIHELLTRDSLIRFVGNVEGNEIVNGKCDVLLCDGFVGNILLKFYESAFGFLEQQLRSEGLKYELPKRVGEIMDYTTYGGVPLLGVNGVSVVCHGASPPRAIGNGIAAAHRCCRGGMVRRMRKGLLRLSSKVRS
ncbi:MAG: phosphate acyltransferase [Gemmatimonadetes bacterium]|nr:phosphate acyltransferase [Gemmatimonadota bacterium]